MYRAEVSRPTWLPRPPGSHPACEDSHSETASYKLFENRVAPYSGSTRIPHPSILKGDTNIPSTIRRPGSVSSDAVIRMEHSVCPCCSKCGPVTEPELASQRPPACPLRLPCGVWPPSVAPCVGRSSPPHLTDTFPEKGWTWGPPDPCPAAVSTCARANPPDPPPSRLPLSILPSWVFSRRPAHGPPLFDLSSSLHWWLTPQENQEDRVVKQS